MNFNLSGYRIKEILHNGKEYTIYKGERIANNLPVIIKVPHDTYHYAQAVIRLHNDFETGHLYNHKNIVKYIDLHSKQNEYFLIREFFDGLRLEDFVPAKGLDTEAFLKIAIQLADGLGEIHSKNIIHQLIKPSNILINPETLHIKITDFGRSTHHFDSTPDIRSFKDSFLYISPEQTGRMDRNVDYRTDFYSLGTTFYKLLTGKLPFNAHDLLEIIHMHMAKDVVSPTVKNKNIPLLISKIVLKLLSKNPDDRYQSAEGLKYDLTYCLKNFSGLNKNQHFEIAQHDFSEKFQIPDKLYGRNKEINLLQEEFAEVCNGGSAVVMITGFSGIGKSSLVNELQKKISLKDAYLTTGKFEQLKQNIAYSAISDAFKTLIQQILREDELKIKRWKTNLHSALQNNGQLIIDIIPQLEILIGKQPPVAKLGPTEAQNRFQMVFQDFISVFHTLAHPLVIFLDDLQWIDLASVKLLKILTSGYQTKSFFFIGAWRSNEVTAGHPILTTLEEIQNVGVQIKYIRLHPLKEEHINNMVSDTLNAPLEETRELSRLITKKTNGNPFFVKSYLFNLYNKDLITYSGKAQWNWELRKIKLTLPTDNVFEFMAGSIKELPMETRDALIAASVIGTSFDVATLQIILDKTKSELPPILQPAVENGMLIKLKQKFKFVHDKVLEAAYSFIAVDDRAKTHLQTGRALLQDFLSNQKSEENLTQIVEHLNKGIGLIENKSELEQLLKLNLRVAHLAKNSTAYKSAGHFFEFASHILPEDSWQSQYQQTLNIYTEWAEAENMSVNFSKAKQLFQIVLDNTKSTLDKTPVFQMMLVDYENNKRFREAVELAVNVLQELKVDFVPPGKLTPEIEKEQETLFFQYISQYHVEKILNIKPAKDKIYIEAIGILASVLVPFWNTYPKALAYISYRIVNLAIIHGLTPGSSIGFSFLGSIFTSIQDKVDLGYQIAKIAVSITEKFRNNFFGTAVKYMFFNHIHYWKKPLKWKMDELLQTFHSGIETGNNQWASYCINHYCIRHILIGTKLIDVKKHYDKYTDLMYKFRQEAPLTYFNPPKQFVYNLMGLSGNPVYLTGNFFHEETGIREFLQTQQYSAAGLAYTFKLFLFILFSENKEALEFALREETEECIRANTSQFQQYPGLCMLALLLLRSYDNATKDIQVIILAKTKELRDEFQRYSEINPVNFAPYYYIINAEFARIEQDNSIAVDYYDKAIESADDSQFIHIKAIACETASNYWLKRSKPRIANDYLYEAYLCYDSWGCEAKVNLLLKEFPELLPQVHKTNNTPLSHSLDLKSILKSNQVISSEIVIEKLLNKLILIIIENAGAQKGYIILKEKQEMNVVSGINLEKQANPISSKIPLDEINSLSQDLTRLTINTGKTILLTNAFAEGQFTNDPYIQHNKSKSLLIMPLNYKGQVMGAIFLENNLATGVFSKSRTELLQILLSQAAISIENARLYNDSLKAREELKAINNELIATNEALKESEERFRRFAENAQDMIYRMSLPAGKYEYVGPASTKIWGYTPEEVYESPLLIQKTIHPDWLGYFKKEWEKLLRGEMEPFYEYKIIDKSGIEKWMHQRNVLVKDEQNRPVAIEGIVTDITVLKKIEEELRNKTEEYEALNEELRQTNNKLTNANSDLRDAKERAEESDRLKTRFLNNMSHEIRTPMNGILGFSELLQDNNVSEQTHRHYIKIIQNSGQQLLHIIDDILEISRLETKQVKVQYEEVSINDLLLELFSIFDMKAKDNKTPLYLRKALTDEASIIKTDKTKLFKVLSNLLENAFKFTNQGFIEFGYTLEKGTKRPLKLFVKDTGIGIRPENNQSIFDRFSQEEKEISQKSGGLGLGLSIAKENTELLGGKLTLQSEKGKGTTFYVELPYEPVYPGTSENEYTHQKQNGPSKKTILIAEDEEVNYLFLHTIITDKLKIDCTIIHAKNGKEAIEALMKNSEIDIILMDIKMPIMDGYEATKKIKESYPTLPVIAQTAYSTIEEQEMAKKAGCDDFISKPIKIELFKKMMERYMAIKK